MATVVCASYEWNLGFAELRALQSAGFDLRAVHSGSDAIRLIGDGAVDALLVSRTLPDMEVEALVQYVKERQPQLPVVMIAGTVPPSGTAPKLIDSVMVRSHAAGLLVPTLELLLNGLPEPLHDAGSPAAA